MNKIKLFAVAIAMVALTSCNSGITTQQLANIVAAGYVDLIEPDQIADIAEVAGRDNIVVKKSDNLSDMYYIEVNDLGRENCAALLY